MANNRWSAFHVGNGEHQLQSQLGDARESLSGDKSCPRHKGQKGGGDMLGMDRTTSGDLLPPSILAPGLLGRQEIKHTGPRLTEGGRRPTFPPFVHADGTFPTASQKQNEDLFWGLRGGGAIPASLLL